MSCDKRRFYGISRAYQVRWDKVTEVRNDLQTEMLEAEVLWGNGIYEKYELLFKLQDELFVAVSSQLRVSNPDEPEQTRQAIRQATQKRRDILYDSDDTSDEYTGDVAKTIASIEAFLKPHLRK